MQLQQSHDGADRMVVLLSIYDEEDEVYQDLVTVATTFFQYLLQPFRDERELACLYKMEILVRNEALCVGFTSIINKTSYRRSEHRPARVYSTTLV